MIKAFPRLLATYGLWIIVFGLGINGARQGLSRLQGTQVRPHHVTLLPPRTTSHTVVRQETLITAAGERRQATRQTDAVKGDGSFVQIFERVGNTLPLALQVVRRTVLFASGLRVVVDDLREIKSTTFDSRTPEFGWRPDPNTRCERNFNGMALVSKDQQVLGEAVTAGYQTVTIRSGGITRWYAPTLGCAMLRVRADFGYRGVSDQIAVSVTAGEPDARLFQIPSGYAEVSPAIMQKLPPDDPRARSRQDYYYAHRPPQSIK